MIIGVACPVHGYHRGTHCPECASGGKGNDGIHINTYDWVTKGDYEHIDPDNPHLRVGSKKELIEQCAKRGLIPKAFMKPKSQGKGWEPAKRGYGC